MDAGDEARRTVRGTYPVTEVALPHTNGAYIDLDNDVGKVLRSNRVREDPVEQDPWRWYGMTLMRRPSPFGELMSLRQAMDRLFEDSFVRPGEFTMIAGETRAPLDVRLTADEIVVQAALAGVKPEDATITIENGTLTITAETEAEREEQEGTWLLREIRRGSFSRAISLPAGLQQDRATANFEDGVLTVRIPRAEEVKPRQIRITPTSTGQGGPVAAGTDEGQG